MMRTINCIRGKKILRRLTKGAITTVHVSLPVNGGGLEAMLHLRRLQRLPRQLLVRRHFRKNFFQKKLWIFRFENEQSLSEASHFCAGTSAHPRYYTQTDSTLPIGTTFPTSRYILRSRIKKSPKEEISNTHQIFMSTTRNARNLASHTRGLELFLSVVESTKL